MPTGLGGGGGRGRGGDGADGTARGLRVLPWCERVMELKAAQPLLTAVNTIEEGERAERDGVAEVDLEPWGGSVDAAVTEGRAWQPCMLCAASWSPSMQRSAEHHSAALEWCIPAIRASGSGVRRQRGCGARRARRQAASARDWVAEEVLVRKYVSPGRVMSAPPQAARA